MTRAQWLLFGLGAALIAWITYDQESGENAIQSGEEDVQAAVAGWQSVNDGPIWVPVINQTEAALGLPANLLARQAYQESRFRTDVISGTTPSTAGALGILQLMPQFFQSVNVPRPYTAADTQAQITEAGNLMASLYKQFNDWGLALAAYNDGAGNVNAFLAGTRQLPTQTTDYVTQILADVPVAGAWEPA